MHILFVTGEYPPQTGGVGAYTAELARALTDLGVLCTVITSRASVLPPTLENDASLDGDAGQRAKVHVLPIIGTWRMGAVRTVGMRAQELGAEWIHLQYQTAAFGMNPSVNFAVRSWQRVARVAWTYHDLLPAYLFPKAGATLRDWVTFRPVSAADAVIATNRSDFERLEQGAGVAHMRLHEIPIGSNVKGTLLSADERRARRLRYGWGDHHLAIGYFGALNRSKGGTALLHTLQSVVERGVDAHLLMIGDVLGASDPTNAAYAEEVRRQIDGMGLNERVQWTGRESGDEVSADLNAVDVCLLPYADGASLRRGTLMAALANGCAIVTTEPQSPIADLRTDEEALFVPLGSDSEIALTSADAIVRLMQDEALRSRLRTGARRASEAFSWQKIARRHLEIYGTHG